VLGEAEDEGVDVRHSPGWPASITGLAVAFREALQSNACAPIAPAFTRSDASVAARTAAERGCLDLAGC